MRFIIFGDRYAEYGQRGSVWGMCECEAARVEVKLQKPGEVVVLEKSRWHLGLPTLLYLHTIP